jgi:predicted nucleotidyltransferase
MEVGKIMGVKNVIYQVIYGSHAYGTNTEESDTDIRGIYLPSIDECLSLKELNDYHKESDLEDTLIYPIQKFFRLAIKCNPSVLEWLFVPDELVMITTKAGEAIRSQKKQFLTQEIYPRFKGYAYAEFSSLTKLTGPTGEKRKKQILKYGYSPKNAMNCIRLMQQGIEMLTTGNLILPRPNAEELLEIKRGEWTYQKIVTTFNNLLQELDEASENSVLVDKPCFDMLNDIMINIIKEYG